MELVPEPKKIRKKNVVNLACNFCKRRHLKCDGNIPCVQCTSRNEECVFGNNLKRGRKSTKENELVVSVPSPVNPLQISSADESFHYTFFVKFMERIAPIFPYFTPKSFSLEISPFFNVKISDNVSWSKIQQLNPINVKTKTIADLINTIEYTLACAHGSRLCNPTSDLSDMFIAKTENILQMLGTNIESDPSLANHLLLLHELTGFYYFSMSRNLDSSHRCAYHNLHSYTIYNMYKQHISGDVANRMFFYLAGTTNDLPDTYHFIKKVKLTGNSYADCINVLVGVGAVSVATLTKPDKEAPVKLKTKVYNKLLTLMRECEMVFSQNPLPTLPWLATLWAIEKAFVLHQLNLPYEEMPLDLLKKLISMMPMFMERRPGNPGVFNAMIFMLLIIPRSQVPMDVWTFCTKLLNDKETQFPGLMRLLRFLNEEEQRIVQLEENTEKSDSSEASSSPSEGFFDVEPNYSELILNVEDVEALLNEDLLLSQIV